MDHAAEQVNRKKNKKDRYWIQPGVRVRHKEYPDIKMVAQKVLQRTEKVTDEYGNEVSKTFIDGVRCHWLDKFGQYQSGVFMTTNLQKWNESATDYRSDGASSVDPTR